MYYFFRNTQISWPIDQSYKSWEKFVHSLSRKTSAYLLEWVDGTSGIVTIRKNFIVAEKVLQTQFY